MSEHLSQEEQQAYRARQLSPVRLLVADRHLEGCEDCREAVRAAGSSSAFDRLRAQLRRMEDKGAPEHLSYEMLEAYVRGQADGLDSEMVESHVEDCSNCARELGDLRAFATMLAESPDVQEAKISAFSAWKDFLAAIRLPFSLRVVGAVTAGLFLVAVSAVMVLNINRSQQEQRAGLHTYSSEEAPAKQADRAGENETQARRAQPSSPVASPPASGSQAAVSPGTTAGVILLLDFSNLQTGEVPTLVLLPQIDFVDLRLKVAPAVTYQARLERTGGAALELGIQSSSQVGYIVFRQSARQLENGEYRLTVSRTPASDTDKPVEYRFIVRR